MYQDLRIAFEEYGEIFFDDFKTGTDRPHGIVQYRDPKDATKAIEAADSEEGLWINERKLFVERYEDKNVSASFHRGVGVADAVP